MCKFPRHYFKLWNLVKPQRKDEVVAQEPSTPGLHHSMFGLEQASCAFKWHHKVLLQSYLIISHTIPSCGSKEIEYI
jgi:hypothetical protein